MRVSNTLLFSLFSLASWIPAQGAAQTVKGRVMDPEGTPLPFATLAVMGEASDTVDITQADAEGRFDRRAAGLPGHPDLSPFVRW